MTDSRLHAPAVIEMIVNLVRTGRSPSSLSREYGMNSATISKWCKRDGVNVRGCVTEKPKKRKQCYEGHLDTHTAKEMGVAKPIQDLLTNWKVV